MSDEVTNNPTKEEVAALQAQIEALKNNNKEILNDYKKAKEQAKAVPEGVNVQELIDFKRKKEQEELEAKGLYEEATQKLAAQYREAEEAKNKEIEELRNKKNELEITAPAMAALGEVVHDAQYVINTLGGKKLEKEADGSVVVVDGYNRTPVKEWAINNSPSWIQKQPKPQGGGSLNSNSINVDPIRNNPFEAATFDLTEQGRLYRTNREKYERLKNAATKG